MGSGAGQQGAHLSTRRISTLTGYSVQQIRDLEALAVIPAARRGPNGYRSFSTTHVVALKAYRHLASAVGPVVARTTMRAARLLPREQGLARIIALHVDLAKARTATVDALHALGSIVDESAREAPPTPADDMTITEVSRAVGVRSSTLRFWEAEGLLSPNRQPANNSRIYPPDAVRDARVIAALRDGGYGIPTVRTIMTTMTDHVGGSPEARRALESRLDTIASQSAALLRAGADLANLLEVPTQ